jgi:two-component system, cell cycle sensor histidine kinase and response regulator CckA
MDGLVKAAGGRSMRWYFLILVGIVAATAAAAVVLVEVQADRDSRRAALADARFAARTAAGQLGEFVSAAGAAAHQLAANPQIGQVLAHPQGCSLSFVGIDSHDGSHLDIIAADGTVACSSRPLTSTDAIRYRAPWLRRALHAHVLVAPETDSRTGAHVAITAFPLSRGKGIVAAFIDLDAAGPRLASLYGGGHPVEFLVTTADGTTVIARSIAPRRWIGSSSAQPPTTTTERKDLDGTERLYGTATVPGTGWRFYAGEEAEAALAAGNRLERRELAIIAAGLAVALLAAWLIHRSLVRPIRAVSRALRETDGSRLDPVPVSGPRELRALGDRINALLGSVEDELRERKRAEASAVQSERSYRLLFESNPNPMWLYDTDTLRFLAVNNAAIQAYGYSRDEFLTMTIADIRPAEDRPRLHAAVAAKDEGTAGFNASGVWRHRRKDGTMIDVEITSHAHEFEGRPARVVLALDVTERLRAETALRRSEARYRDLFENATDLIATVDEQSRLTAVNEAFIRTLGYSREELLGRPIADLVPPEWHQQLQRARDAKLDGSSEASVYEHELIARDGQRIVVEVASRAIMDDGRPVGVEAICRDITERKQLETQLFQSRRLEAIGQLAGGIAHDFNNLLTVISGYTEALIEEHDGASRAELEQIAAAAERATVLTRQLLAFSRRQVMEPQALDLNQIIDGIIPMLGRLIGEDVELVTKLDREIAPVLADANQIEQILLNLAVNARDAMPAGGTLTIETGSVDLDADYAAHHPDATAGPHTLIAVSDTGTGMDAETVTHIFEPFFTTKPVGSGTGLGLSTTYGIVKQSGGNIWVYSEPNQGTTFKVYIPASEQAIAATRKATSRTTPVPYGDETVLVVEDEDALRKLVASILEARGYHVLSAEDPEQALALAHDSPVDLLLTDLVMPQMNGRELSERIHATHPATRVLFMSGYADEAVVRNGSLKPGAVFLEKPFSSIDLARKVRAALDDRADAA